jgi:hypothetical protein
MMKYFLIVFFSLSGFSVLLSQESTDQTKQTASIVRLHILTPGLLLEQKVGNIATLIFDLGTGLRYNYNEINEEQFSTFSASPYFRIEARGYFSRANRESSGKRTDYNSGSYMGFQGKFGFPTKQFVGWTTMGPIIGFQSTIGKRGYWNIGAGLGLVFYEGYSQTCLIGDLGLGFILN